MKPGTYRNRLGVELVVIESAMMVGDFRTLGGIWRAEARDDLFGTTHYLVTEESMKESGYEPVEDGE